MITKIENIYLYTGLTNTGGSDSAKAKKWMDSSNIPHTNLWYGDPGQHESVFKALNTWTFGTKVNIKDFPFVIYDEVHEDKSKVVQCLYGLDAIKNSNIKELIEL